MAAPSLHVWLGQESAIDATPTWVDISAYVRLERGVTVTRGSTRGAGAQPGTASLTLDNTDSRFTVGNTGSPYYPYMHLQSLVKIERDGRPWFIGRIQSMPLSWPSGGDEACYVTVTLADRLARFGRMSFDTFPVEEILALGPAGYWPMAEAAGSVGCGNKTTASWPMTLSTPGDGTVAFGSATGPAGDEHSVAQFTPGTVPAILASTEAAFDNAGTSAMTVSAVFSTTLGGLVARVSARGALSFSNTVTDLQVTTYLGVAGVMVTMYYGDGSADRSFFPAPVLDGLVHTVAVVIGAAAASHPDCYIDGALVAPTLVGAATSLLASAASLQVGSGTSLGTFIPFLNFTGGIGHVAIWARALTSGEISQMSAALQGTTLTTNAAFLKVLGWRNQATGAVIDAGVTDNVSSKTFNSGSLASFLGEISDSEAGTLYVSGSDVVTWKNRRAALSPAITLTAADIDAGITYNCDVQGLVTRVIWNQGGTSGVVDAADIDTIGMISGSVSSISTVTGDGADHASMLANTSPRGPYIGSLAIDMMTATAPVAALVATTGILSKITLTGMPSQTPPGSTVLEVTGETETISHDAWRVTYTTKPAGLGSGRDILIWDDATYGVWDAGHRWAY